MKVTIEFNLPDEKFEYEATFNATANKIKLDSLYDEVFRPHFKYDKPILNSYLTNKEKEIIEKIWDEISEFLND